MGEIKGIYAAAVSILNNDLSLDVNKTVKHCENIIKDGCHGVVLFGSTFGLLLRILIQNNLKINLGFNIQNISIINFLASFFLGMLVAINFVNTNILLFFTGFLGCFSTFSSFIY